MKPLLLVLFTCMMSGALAQAPTGDITVTIYGKGETTVELQPDGSSKTTFCPEEAQKVCALLSLPPSTSPIVYSGTPVKVVGIDGATIGNLYQDLRLRTRRGEYYVKGRKLSIE